MQVVVLGGSSLAGTCGWPGAAVRASSIRSHLACGQPLQSASCTQHGSVVLTALSDEPGQHAHGHRHGAHMPTAPAGPRRAPPSALTRTSLVALAPSKGTQSRTSRPQRVVPMAQRYRTSPPPTAQG